MGEFPKVDNKLTQSSKVEISVFGFSEHRVMSKYDKYSDVQPSSKSNALNMRLSGVVGIIVLIAISIALFVLQSKVLEKAMPFSNAASNQPAIRTVEMAKSDLRKIGVAMIVHSSIDRRGRFLPIGHDGRETWLVALAEATRQFEPNSIGEGSTNVRLVTGPGTFFDDGNPNSGNSQFLDSCNRPASTIPLAIKFWDNLAEGVSESTIFVFNPDLPKKELGNVADSFLMLMADGSVRRFPASISSKAFHVLCQIHPTIAPSELDSVVTELKDLGLPTKMPVAQRAEKSSFE